MFVIRSSKKIQASVYDTDWIVILFARLRCYRLRLWPWSSWCWPRPLPPPTNTSTPRSLPPCPRRRGRSPSPASRSGRPTGVPPVTTSSPRRRARKWRLNRRPRPTGAKRSGPKKKPDKSGQFQWKLSERARRQLLLDHISCHRKNTHCHLEEK